ncbi:MAG: hypothetical protein H6842_11240 [Rhodospirillaceae bacterium]|nr:hypothetical protein [Rhodospirillaceae bacterium]
MKSILTAIGFGTAAAFTAAASLAYSTTSAHAQDFYSLHLTGVQVVQEGPRGHDDDAFVIAYVVEENGNVTQPVFAPGENRPWEGLNAGDILRLDQTVWRGPAQSIVLQAHVYEYHTGLADFMRGFVQVTTAVSGALIAVGTGGTGAVAGVGVALAGQQAAQAVHDTIGPDHVPLGIANQTVELRRVGALADRPQHEHQGIYYDFYTEHAANGALYGLFWEVRR